MSSLKYWVWLSSMVDLKPVTRYKLIEAFGDPEAVFFANEKALLEKLRLNSAEIKLLSDKGLAVTEGILENCHSGDVTILTINDAAYPNRLRSIYDPPVVLYIKGRLPAMDEQAAIGVVGTRDATPYGIKMGRRLGFEITRGGGLVVTGLAKGVDSASAEGALRAGGGCVGVLGCAIDKVFPAFNEALFRDVSAVGALVSEYPPGTLGDKRFFPERNRIISGLSVGVVIIEAPAISGALITARRALEQGREVFAVPGNSDAPSCAGSNNLIREGALLVSGGGDVLSEFAERFPEKILKPDSKKALRIEDEETPSAYPAAAQAPVQKTAAAAQTGKGFVKLRVRNERKNVDKPKKREYIDLREQLSGLTETQLKIVSAMDEDSIHIDDIIDKTQLSAATVLSELTVLEIKGFVAHGSGKRFTLNVNRQ